MPTFGENLRELRRRKGMVQAELAEKVGLNRSSISTLETGSTHPRPATIRALASALEVEPDELFEGAAGSFDGQEDRDDRLVMRQQYEQALTSANKKLRSDLASLDVAESQNTAVLYALFTLASMTSMQARVLTESEPFLQEVEGETVPERRALRGFLEAADSLSETATEIAEVIETKGERESGILYVLKDARRRRMAS
jgi:transcriptional regulator with XRE-family HTH domain